MNIIEQIKAEIERRWEEAHSKYKETADQYYDGMCTALDHLEAFLDTLEEKPVDLEKEIENAGKDVIRQAHYHNKIFDIPQTHFEDVQLMDIFKAGVYKGFELGRNAK